MGSQLRARWGLVALLLLLGCAAMCWTTVVAEASHGDIDALRDEVEYWKKRSDRLERENEHLAAKRDEAGGKSVQEKSVFAQYRQLQDTLAEEKGRAESEKERANYFAKHLEAAEKEVKVLKDKIASIEAKLKITEESLLTSQEKAAAVAAEAARLETLAKAWLPPWAVERSTFLKARAQYHWKLYGEPAMTDFRRKADTAWAATHAWAMPHLINLHNTSAPAVEYVRGGLHKAWNETSKVVQPHVEGARAKLGEGYDQVITMVTPHWQKVRVAAEPLVQTISENLGPPFSQAGEAAAKYRNESKQWIRTKLQQQNVTFLKDEHVVSWLITALEFTPILTLLLSLPFLPRLLRKSKPGTPSTKVAKASAHKRAHHRRPRRE